MKSELTCSSRLLIRAIIRVSVFLSELSTIMSCVSSDSAMTLRQWRASRASVVLMELHRWRRGSNAPAFNTVT